MKLHSLRVAASLTAALTTAVSPLLVSAQTAYEFKAFKQGLVVNGPGSGQTSGSGDNSSPQPVLHLSTTTINFGDVATKTTETRQVLVSNTGTGSLSFTSAPAVTGDPAFGAGPTTCGASLTAGADCLTDVTFSPTAAGVASGRLTIATSAGTQDVTLSGAGIALLVTKAEYGGVWGADGNLTSKLKAVCDGKTTCTYLPLSIFGSDPYPGRAKDHTAEYSCGVAGSARIYSVAEAGVVSQTLSCSMLASIGNGTITITSATWGGNRGANNNIQLALATACDGRKLCEFAPLEVNSGIDPYPSMPKDMTVTYTCNGATKTLYSAVGQEGKKVLSCS